MAADGLAGINNQLQNGSISEEDALAKKLQLFNDLRTRTPENIATTEALLGTLGLPVAESAEASKALAENEIVSPQQASTGIFSAKDLLFGTRDVVSNVFAGTGEFITGGDIPGFGFGN